MIICIFNNILETRKIPTEWKEAKMMILHKKGDGKGVFFKKLKTTDEKSHIYKLFPRSLKIKKS